MGRKIVAGMLLSLAAATSQAALLGRAALTPGGTDYQAYYDDVLNITWLADANYAATVHPEGLYSLDGNMTYSHATQFIDELNSDALLGISTWRLPTVSPVNGVSFASWPERSDGGGDTGYNISAVGSVYPGSTASEMAHLYYTTLQNPGWRTVDGGISTDCVVRPQGGTTCLLNPGPFSNLNYMDYTPFGYLSGTPWVDSQGQLQSGNVWCFQFNGGFQAACGAGNPYWVWPVADGDPFALQAAVPTPAAVWLFGSALGLMGWMRRKASA